MESKYAQLKSLVLVLDIDYEKFKEQKIKVSGTRLRNSLLTIKKLCDSLRKDIMSEIKALPVKKRVKKTLTPVEQFVENFVEDKTVEDKTVEDKTVEDKTVDDKTVEDDVLVM